MKRAEKRVIVIQQRYDELLKKEVIYDLLKNGLTERQFDNVILSAQFPLPVDELAESIYETNKRKKEHESKILQVK